MFGLEHLRSLPQGQAHSLPDLILHPVNSRGQTTVEPYRKSGCWNVSCTSGLGEGLDRKVKVEVSPIPQA